MSAIDDVIHFFEMEIEQTKEWLDDENVSPIFNGVNVGFKEAKRLKEYHILYCQNIIERILGAKTDEHDRNNRGNDA